MSRLSILKYPDPRLHSKASPVLSVDDSIRQLVTDMADTMYAAPGIGLAATQVDVHKRVIVIDVSEDRNRLLTLINPEIIGREGTQICEEGCLSVPGIYEDVERSERVMVRALDRNGQSFELEAEELLAVCIQHEMDHLEGILFIDHLSRLKRSMALKKLEKLRKAA